MFKQYKMTCLCKIMDKFIIVHPVDTIYLQIFIINYFKIKYLLCILTVHNNIKSIIDLYCIL